MTSTPIAWRADARKPPGTASSRRQLGRLPDTATHQDLDLQQPHRTPGGPVAGLYCAAGQKRTAVSIGMLITSVISGVHLL